MLILGSFEPICGIAKMKNDSKDPRIGIRCYFQKEFFTVLFLKIHLALPACYACL
jgi:hypothetical protein